MCQLARRAQRLHVGVARGFLGARRAEQRPCGGDGEAAAGRPRAARERDVDLAAQVRGCTGVYGCVRVCTGVYGCVRGCKSAASGVRRVIQDLAIAAAAAAAVPCTNGVSMRPAWWRSGKMAPEAPSSWRAPALVSKHVAAEG